MDGFPAQISDWGKTVSMQIRVGIFVDIRTGVWDGCRQGCGMEQVVHHRPCRQTKAWTWSCEDSKKEGTKEETYGRRHNEPVPSTNAERTIRRRITVPLHAFQTSCRSSRIARGKQCMLPVNAESAGSPRNDSSKGMDGPRGAVNPRLDIVHVMARPLPTGVGTSAPPTKNSCDVMAAASRPFDNPTTTDQKIKHSERLRLVYLKKSDSSRRMDAASFPRLKH